MVTEKFIRIVNDLRRANKNQWFTATFSVNGKDIQIKCFNTYAQILRVDGINHGGQLDLSVREFEEMLYVAVN